MSKNCDHSSPLCQGVLFKALFILPFFYISNRMLEAKISNRLTCVTNSNEPANVVCVRYFTFSYLLMIANQTSYWWGRNSLNLGITEKVILNLACSEKADELVVYTDKVLLELIHRVKVILLEF